MNESSKNNGSSHNNSNNIGMDLAGNIITLLKGGFNSSFTDGNSNSMANGSKSQNVISSKIDDYLLDILMKDLSHNIKGKSNIEDASDGTFLKFEDSFSLFDIKALKDMLEAKGIKEIMSQGLNDKETKDNIEKSSQMASVLNNIFYNSIIIKIDSGIIIADNSNLRGSHSQLQMANFTKRKLHIFGRLESKITEEDLDLKSLEDDSTLSNGGLGIIAPKLSLTILSYLFGLKEGDRLIKPIALYFK